MVTWKLISSCIEGVAADMFWNISSVSSTKTVLKIFCRPQIMRTAQTVSLEMVWTSTKHIGPFLFSPSPLWGAAFFRAGRTDGGFRIWVREGVEKKEKDLYKWLKMTIYVRQIPQTPTSISACEHVVFLFVCFFPFPPTALHFCMMAHSVLTLQYK